MNQNSNVSVDTNRILVSKLGALVGRNLIVVERTSADIKYSDKIVSGALTTNREINLWSTKPIYIKSFSHDKDLNGNINVVFNNDPELTLPLIGVKEVGDLFPKITPSTMKEVYENAINNNRKPIFVDYPGAVQQVVNLNLSSIAEINRMVDELMVISQNIEKANVTEKHACEIEMHQIGTPTTIAVQRII